ncbi:hypothetical protein BJ508DRAFT_305510 [Ascobolus immersus RN42]|uniref:Uncharacterized protein n=1 Tax=Ascobolus immersus RN42 TaxID=1160509 RepID=A0A3N4IM05_ASCIM|nr:hypothetical protein BJ508DRAFT_305510 [Ascobolus immersus RN42]
MGSANTPSRPENDGLAGITEEAFQQQGSEAQQAQSNAGFGTDKDYFGNLKPNVDEKGVGVEEEDFDDVSSVESNEECRFCREWREAQECTPAHPCPACREVPDIEASLEQHAFHKLLESYDYEHTPYSKDLDSIEHHFRIAASPENLWRYDGRGLKDHILFEDKMNRGSYWVTNTRFEFANRVSEDLQGLLEYLKDPSIGVLQEIIPDWVLEVEEDRRGYRELVTPPAVSS